MSRDHDVRDRLIDAALRYADNELAIRTLTKRMKASRCRSSPPCWAQDEAEAWKDRRAEIPDDYCDECVRSTILCRERHGLRQRTWTRREILLRRAADFRGSIYGACAGPATGSGVTTRDRASAGEPPCNHPSFSETASA